MVNRQAMINQLVLHEGLKLVPYPDTDGNLTVGVGYNIHARGWDLWEQLTGYVPSVECPATREGCLTVLNADLDRLEQAVPRFWPYYAKLDEIRQRVVLDMAFNMGLNALGFKKAIAAAEDGDWSRTVREMYKSKWGHQVGEGHGQRCDRLAHMMLTDQAPTDVPDVVTA